MFCLILENSWLLLLQYFFPVLSSSGVLIIHILQLLKLSQSSWRFRYFLPNSILIWEIFLIHPQSSLIVSSAVFSLLMSQSKTFLIFVCCCCYALLISSISFQFFLAVSISLLPLPIWYYIMSAFPIRTLNILIIIILELSDHSIICIRVESDSDVQFVSRLFSSSIILAPLETFKWKMDVMY